MNMEERIHEVVIPMEDVVEFKNGKKVVVQKKVFPGYLLVRCNLDDDSWYVVRNTPGVTGFVGQGAKPSPLPRRDVEAFLQVKPEGDEAATRKGKPRLEYELGETVRVKEGPFADFSGEIVEINEDQLKVKVLVNIFGRETPGRARVLARWRSSSAARARFGPPAAGPVAGARLLARKLARRLGPPGATRPFGPSGASAPRRVVPARQPADLSVALRR